jgi:hypothetical protein
LTAKAEARFGEKLEVVFQYHNRSTEPITLVYRAASCQCIAFFEDGQSDPLERTIVPARGIVKFHMSISPGFGDADFAASVVCQALSVDDRLLGEIRFTCYYRMISSIVASPTKLVLEAKDQYSADFVISPQQEVNLEYDERTFELSERVKSIWRVRCIDSSATGSHQIVVRSRVDQSTKLIPVVILRPQGIRVSPSSLERSSCERGHFFNLIVRDDLHRKLNYRSIDNRFEISDSQNPHPSLLVLNCRWIDENIPRKRNAVHNMAPSNSSATRRRGPVSRSATFV